MKKTFLTIISIFSFLISPLSLSLAHATSSTNPADYHSAWQSQSAYLDMKTGETATIWIKFTNKGNATWYNSGNNAIHLGTSNQLDRSSSFSTGSWLAANRPATLSEASVAPGQIGTFTFEIKAPSQTGQYTEYFRPVAENLTWMEDNGVFIKINVNNGTSDSSYSSQLYSQSEKSITLGQQETKTVWVKYKNTGTSTWYNSGSYPIHLATDHSQDRTSVFYSSSWLAKNRPVGMTESSVKPGEYGTFEFTIKAPSSNGTYTEYFRPVAEGQTWFNDTSTYWQITVKTTNDDEDEDTEDTSELNFSAKSTSSGVKLTWDEYDDDMDSYKILRSTSDSTPTYPSQSYQHISYSDTTSYTDTSVTDSKKYYYRLAVYLDGEVTLYSDTITITYNEDGNDDSDDSSDLNFSAKSNSSGVKLTWDEYDDDIDSYKILRSTSDSSPTYPDQSYKSISSTSTTSYTDTSVTDGKKYYYRLAVYYDGDVELYSDTITITYNEDGDDDSDSDFTLEAESRSSGVKLTWDTYEDDDDAYYVILRSTSDSTPTYSDQYYDYVDDYDTTSYTDTSVTDGKKYYYRIGVYKDSEILSYSNTVTITYNEDGNDDDEDSSELDFAAKSNSSGVKLTWDEYDDDIDSYKILRSTSDSSPTYPDQSYKSISSTSTTSYTDTSVTDGKKYYYRLAVYYDGDVELYSDTITITYNEDGDDDANIDLEADNIGDGIELTWDEYDDDSIDGYKILRSTSDSTPTYDDQYYDYVEDYDTTSYTDTSVTDGKKYYYRIAVYDSGDVIAYSNIVSITYDEDAGNDFTLTVSNASNGVKLEWDTYDDDMDSYKILRSTSDSSPTYPNQSYTYINDEDTTTYTDKNVENDEKYYYRIAVYYDGDIVAYSNTVNITFDDSY